MHMALFLGSFIAMLMMAKISYFIAHVALYLLTSLVEIGVSQEIDRHVAHLQKLI